MPSSLPDPIALARRQLESDRLIDRTAKGLFAAKRARMAVSAFAFLRGSAPMFHDVVRRTPSLARGPGGRAWITGDLHVQNFGAYRTDDASSGRTRVVFGPNDFDEACVGPVRLDVLRVAVSWLLAQDEHGLSAARRIESCRALVDGWVLGAFGSRIRSTEPACVTRLVDQVEKRTKATLLRSYVHGRALLRDDRLWPISRALAARVRRSFDAYADRASVRYDMAREHFEVLDVARRVAGTGSLGVERFCLLARGGDRGAWLFDLKEEAPSSASGLPAGGKHGAQRVVCGLERAAIAPPRMLGTAPFVDPHRGQLSMLVRRLSPQEDKLDPNELDERELDPLAHHLGWLAGRMHRQGAIGPLGRAWSTADRRLLLEQAITLAGLHEALHLAYVSIA
jgi:uncharacterized protein (DUF2252 family)